MFAEPYPQNCQINWLVLLITSYQLLTLNSLSMNYSVLTKFLPPSNFVCWKTSHLMVRISIPAGFSLASIIGIISSSYIASSC